MRSNFLPFCLPEIGADEKNEVLDTLDSGWLTTGPKVKRFEDDLRKYVGCREIVAVNSCTAALHLSLLGANVGPNDEVITSTLTFCSTANVVVHCGAKPALLDIDRNTYNMDIGQLEDRLKKGARPKAVIPVHYSGRACDMDAIWALSQKYGFTVIEDAAHALGATLADGTRVGKSDRSLTTCFSFYAIKNMTTGEGGAIAVNNTLLADRLRMLSLHGISKDAWRRYGAAGSWYYEVHEPGYKCNMMDLQAALGLHQLTKLDAFIEKRRQLAAMYDTLLADIGEIRVPPAGEPGRHARHLYPIRLDTSRLNGDRGLFIQKMKEHNIGTTVNFVPVHMHPYYQKNWDFREGDYPVAEEVYRGLVSLPMYPKMTEDDLNDVVDAAKEVLSDMRR